MYNFNINKIVLQYEFHMKLSQHKYCFIQRGLKNKQNLLCWYIREVDSLGERFTLNPSRCTVDLHQLMTCLICSLVVFTLHPSQITSVSQSISHHRLRSTA